ncbi:hypothetical protein H6503_01860 [Candidatus Woesearchaeota archaeon]|nr:hypothetical protein [Candidatus Woesearchaeota archaeon]
MTENLKQWYMFYRKNRDLMLKKIDKLEEKDGIITITNKDGTREICIIEENPLSYEEIIRPYKKDERLYLVSLNKKANIDLMVKEWDSIVDYSFLTMMFVNPQSSQENKWILKPAVHHKITEKAVLKTGLYSLAEAVEMC